MKDKPRRPWLAGLLTLLVTGLGHLYAGKPVRGMLLFVINQLLILVFAIGVNVITPGRFLTIPAVLAGVAFIVFCVMDAISIARKNRETYEPAKYNRWFAYAGFIVLSFILSNIYMVYIIFPHFIGSYKFPSGSMEPTLLIGDHLIAGKLNQTSSPKRGDIMIFRYPNNPKILYLKRIIGEPGDKVEMTGRTVYINGKSLKEDYVRYIDPSSVDQHYGPLNIPPESYFVLGDNRDNSADSRFWGCVPKKNLIGKPLFIYWSFEAPKDEYLRSEPSDKLKQLGDRILHIFTKTRWSRTFRVIE